MKYDSEAVKLVHNNTFGESKACKRRTDTRRKQMREADSWYSGNQVKF